MTLRNRAHGCRSVAAAELRRHHIVCRLSSASECSCGDLGRAASRPAAADSLRGPHCWRSGRSVSCCLLMMLLLLLFLVLSKLLLLLSPLIDVVVVVAVVVGFLGEFG